MIKKITLIVLCLVFLISCGKKGNPEYTVEKSILLNRS